MSGHARVLTSHIKRYDPDLFAETSTDGIVEIYRKQTVWEAFKYRGKLLRVSTLRPHFVTCLTEDWTHRTSRREWGIDKVIDHLKDMDQWRKDAAVDEIRRHNEKLKENKARERHNNFRAAAADSRRDFARMTNDINTSTLSKETKRKKKNGYL